MYLVVENSERAKALLPIHVVTVGADFLQPPSRRPSGAPFHHIFFVDRGMGRFRTDAGEILLGEGSAMFMQKGYRVHYEGVTDDFRTGWITFDGEGVAAVLDYFGAAPFSHQSDTPLRELRRACTRAAERKAGSEVLSGLAYDLLMTYFRALDERPQSSKLAAAKAYIEAHYKQDIAVADVAEAVGVCASLLYRLFREDGSTPVDHLRAVRLGHAKRLLLESPKMPIADIAAACGFADSAYFCKVFRDREGMTPRGYRALYI